MKNLDQNFKYFIMLLIILILGILIFGNYDLNLSLIEGMDYTNKKQNQMTTNLKNTENSNKIVHDTLETATTGTRHEAPDD